MTSKPAAAKRRYFHFPTVGFAKQATEEETTVINFEPMILSFHQIVYEVRMVSNFVSFYSIFSFHSVSFEVTATDTLLFY